MLRARITREEFLEDNQGRTFSDVVNDPEQPFGEVLEFFNGADQQRRMEESETQTIGRRWRELSASWNRDPP